MSPSIETTAAEPRTRSLLGLRPLIVFADGVPADAASRGDVLCAWAVTWDGSRELLALEEGSKDDPGRAWAFLDGLKERGLTDPVLIVTDGESPLFRAAELVFPAALVQRCLARHARELASRLGEQGALRVMQLARAACEAPSEHAASTLRRDLTRRHAATLPWFVGYFERTFDSCTAHLSLPRPLHRVARATLVPECLHAALRRLEGGGSDGDDAGRAPGPRDVGALRRALEAVLADGADIVVSDADRHDAEVLAARLRRRARRAG